MARLRFAMLLVVGVALVMVGFSTAGAQEIRREPARAIQSVEGVDLFNAYCAVCHGKDAKGRGPAAAALKTPPADLTMLAKKNGGKFSANSVQSAIMGMDKMSSHGNEEMPVWGPVFKALSDDAGRTLRVANLTKYIESVQAK